MHQRGYLVLHASAVVVAKRAVAFLGDSGTGKSTLAQGLAGAGHKLVCDDVLAVRVTHGTAIVQPGFARVKLWPDVLAQLGEDAEALPRVQPGLDKRSRASPLAQPGAPIQLARAYLVADAEDVPIHSMAPQQRLNALVQNLFTARLLRRAGGEVSFRACMELAQQPGLVRRLQRPLDLSQVGRVTRAVEADVGPG